VPVVMLRPDMSLTMPRSASAVSVLVVVCMVKVSGWPMGVTMAVAMEAAEDVLKSEPVGRNVEGVVKFASAAAATIDNASLPERISGFKSKGNG